MYSDAHSPIWRKDLDFGKNGCSASPSRSKGLHLDIIHNIDRPFESDARVRELDPHLHDGAGLAVLLKRRAEHRLLPLSLRLRAAILTGECISGFHEDSRYHSRITVKRCSSRHRTTLLQKAQPLMEIYKAPQADLFRAFLKNDAATVGARQNILSAPPLYTMPEDLLGRILKRSGMSAADAEGINATLKQQNGKYRQILTANTRHRRAPHVSEEAFRASPLTLSLSNAFIESTVTYTYEEYTAHLKATKMFAEQHPNYTVRFAEKPAFRNIKFKSTKTRVMLSSKARHPFRHSPQ